MPVAAEAFLIDMVHHNPGEEPLDTAFTDPFLLKSMGYNGQCFKHLNTVMRFDHLLDVAQPSNAENDWLESCEQQIRKEIEQAKHAGLLVFYHIDLFVLPQRIVDAFAHAICDPETGRISIHSAQTIELHRQLFDEMFRRFPEVDGIIPRIGETYLFDTPFHTGNGAVVYEGEHYSQREVDEFSQLLMLLRGEICIKHNRYLIHRTWDIQNNRFHSNREFYLKVTNAIAPHEKLLFSIKHTHIDFHRYAKWNPCLGAGKHRQVVEIQCQREYEGKGAYPHFTSGGVVDGFPEVKGKECLRAFVKDGNFAGVFSWSRGGGWYGPYVDKSNEFWAELNVRFLTKFLHNPDAEELSLFNDITREDLDLQPNDQHALYRISKLSLDAVLKGKFCSVWDKRPGAENDKFPTNQWMRDDVLGGWDLLEPIFGYLYENDLGRAAIDEKLQAIVWWKRIVDISCELEIAHNIQLKKVIQASCQYGLRLFTYIADAWQILYLDFCLRQGDAVPLKQLEDSLRAAKLSWSGYCWLEDAYPCCATLYRTHGWHWPQDPPSPGLGEAISEIEHRISELRNYSAAGL